MSTLAVCVMAYDEAECLRRCLTSVQELGELHVSVDRATRDNSAAVAAEFGAHLYNHVGLPPVAPEQDHPEAPKAANSYARMRNEVLDAVCARTQAPWIMWLDADEIVSSGGPELVALLPQVAPDMDAVGAVMRLFTPTGHCESTMRNSKVIRRGVRFTRRRHECLVLEGGQLLNDSLVIDHLPTQSVATRRQHDDRKLQLDAFAADWREFRDGRAAFYLADAWNLHGHPDEAVNWVERALALPEALNPALQRGHVALYGARLAMHRGDLADARRYSFMALECEWLYAEAVYQLGQLAAVQEKMAEAEHWFRLALMFPPQPLSVMQQTADCSRALPLYGLACVARSRQDRPEAYRLLLEAEKAATLPHPEFADLRAKLDRDEVRK